MHRRILQQEGAIQVPPRAMELKGPQTDTEGPYGSVLSDFFRGVRQRMTTCATIFRRARRAPVHAPPPYEVPDMATADEELWKEVGEALGLKKPRAPSVRYLGEVKAVDAVLEFLRTTRVGCVGVGRVPPEDRGDDSDGEEEGGQDRPRMFPSFVFSFVVVPSSFSFLLVVWEAHYDRLGRSGRKGRWYIEKPTTAAMALRAACSGIGNKRSHTLPTGRFDIVDGGWDYMGREKFT